MEGEGNENGERNLQNGCRAMLIHRLTDVPVPNFDHNMSLSVCFTGLAPLKFLFFFNTSFFRSFENGPSVNDLGVSV